MTLHDPQGSHDKSPLPVEVEVFINPDGSVTFADLEAGTLPIVYHLNPEDPLACDLPDRTVEQPESRPSHE
jgi:hypothetical protein